MTVRPRISTQAGDQNGYSNYVAYNDFDLLGTVAEPGYKEVLREYWGVPNFTKTAFSILQVSSTQVRGMVLGGIKASPSKPVPVKPWMSFQNYIAPDWGGRVPTYNNNIFWQEQLLHMAASGVNQFHYFNPCACAPTASLPSVHLFPIVKTWIGAVFVVLLTTRSHLCVHRRGHAQGLSV